MKIVAYSCNKIALHTTLRNLNLKSQFSIFDSFRDIRVHSYDLLKFVGGLWALKWAGNLFVGSIDRYYENNTFQLKFLF